MSTWRRKLFEEFPEFGHAVETWELGDAASQLDVMLEGATRAERTADIARIVKFLLWSDAQVKSDEQFVYFVQRVLSTTVRQGALLRSFVGRLDESKFGKLAQYIEYNTSPTVVLEAAETVRLETRRRH